MLGIGVQFLNRRLRMTRSHVKLPYSFFTVRSELGVDYDDCYNLGPSSHPRGLRPPNGVERGAQPILVQNIVLCLTMLSFLHLHIFM